jgi:hypothetical protein
LGSKFQASVTVGDRASVMQWNFADPRRQPQHRQPGEPALAKPTPYAGAQSGAATPRALAVVDLELVGFGPRDIWAKSSR